MSLVRHLDPDTAGPGEHLQIDVLLPRQGGVGDAVGDEFAHQQLDALEDLIRCPCEHMANRLP